MKALAIISILSIILMAVPIQASAERPTVFIITDVSQFDVVGTNVGGHSEQYGSSTPGIHLYDGGWGKVKCGEYSIAKVTFMVHAFDAEDGYSVTFQSEYGYDNYLEIYFIPLDTQKIRIQMTDYYDEEMNSEWVEVYVDTIGKDTNITIDLKYTDNNYDGVCKKVVVRVGEESTVQWDLFKSEYLNAKNPERTWVEVMVEADAQSDLVVDDIRIEAKEGNPMEFNFSFCVLLSMLALLFILLIRSSSRRRGRPSNRVERRNNGW